MKRHYQADLLRTLADEDDSIIGLWKRMMVLDAIYGISRHGLESNNICFVTVLSLIPDNTAPR
jgi:hypothetical protein